MNLFSIQKIAQHNQYKIVFYVQFAIILLLNQSNAKHAKKLIARLAYLNYTSKDVQTVTKVQFKFRMFQVSFKKL